MPIMFNALLCEAGLPPKDIRLLRLKDQRATPGRSPYELWRDHPSDFQSYLSIDSIERRRKLTAPYWAVFLVDFNGDTMFGGLYNVKYRGLLEHDTPSLYIEGDIYKAGTCDVYDVTPNDALQDLIGRLFVDWGPAARAWIQYADRQNKPITELRTAFREEEFPGFLNFVRPLSKLDKLPKSWTTAFQNSRGVYLLSCPKTKEQYVGSATGEDGFWGRWQQYLQTGHGGNVGLKSREPSDYQVSILEVAGSSATTDDILAMEGRWQCKLQSKEMGLNRNLARRL